MPLKGISERKSIEGEERDLISEILREGFGVDEAVRGQELLRFEVRQRLWDVCCVLNGFYLRAKVDHILGNLVDALKRGKSIH